MAEPIRVSISSTKLLTKKLYVRKREREKKKKIISSFILPTLMKKEIL